MSSFLPQVVQNMLQYECAGAKEWSYMVCSEPEFSGLRYPAPFASPRWDEWFNGQNDQNGQHDTNIAPLTTIQSVFVPPHAEFWVQTNRTNGNLTAKYRGPGFLVHLDHHLWWWNTTDTPSNLLCSSELSLLCNQQVQWKDVEKWKVKRWISWPDWLHHVLLQQSWLLPNVKKNQITSNSFSILGYTHSLTRDQFINLYQIQLNENKICFQAWQQLKQAYPLSYNDIPLNLFEPKCDPYKELVPSEALISNGSEEQCWQMIKTQLENHEFVFQDDQGGSNIVPCGNIGGTTKTIYNVNRQIWNDTFRTTKTMQRLYDSEINQFTWAIYSLFVICFLILGFYSMYSTRFKTLFHEKQKDSKPKPNDFFQPWSYVDDVSSSSSSSSSS
jgi:hypothetical protein